MLPKGEQYSFNTPEEAEEAATEFLTRVRKLRRRYERISERTRPYITSLQALGETLKTYIKENMQSFPEPRLYLSRITEELAFLTDVTA